jgi:hypothetical protein
MIRCCFLITICVSLLQLTVPLSLLVITLLLCIQVWDTRVQDVKAVGTLLGHTAGVTCIATRNDGRHIISNSKVSLRCLTLQIVCTINALDYLHECK